MVRTWIANWWCSSTWIRSHWSRVRYPTCWSYHPLAAAASLQRFCHVAAWNDSPMKCWRGVVTCGRGIQQKIVPRCCFWNVWSCSCFFSLITLARQSTLTCFPEKIIEAFDLSWPFYFVLSYSIMLFHVLPIAQYQTHKPPQISTDHHKATLRHDIWQVSMRYFLPSISLWPQCPWWNRSLPSTASRRFGVCAVVVSTKLWRRGWTRKLVRAWHVRRLKVWKQKKVFWSGMVEFFRLFVSCGYLNVALVCWQFRGCVAWCFPQFVRTPCVLRSGCDVRDQTQMYRCTVSHESEALAQLVRCFERRGIFDCDAQVPDVEFDPLSSFRGKVLNHDMAWEIMEGHWSLDAESCSWRPVLGQNPAYDYFPCQYNTWYRDPRGNRGWYDPVFKVITLDGREVWRKRHYRVLLGDVPGSFQLSTEDNGISLREFWRIVDADDALTWAVFHYAGAAKSVGQSYTGSLLVTKDGLVPTCRSGQAERIRKAFEKAQVAPFELQLWLLCSLCCWIVCFLRFNGFTTFYDFRSIPWSWGSSFSWFQCRQYK